ncbi:hypothetical protein FOCC_FOCC017834 [Frankliniella occidentalis]|uniref:Dual specificity protein phosphatase 23-like n=1 Tax=Frankliniella occidentalis TaxID=133901 RepID=A0A9C6XCH1_FRAOC|nr:dual specificity protein phosphatase 23-like [Frankliniella occidentalis]KAE8736712.1 hypothetical protein FOCC_FOCC017834 [Frankliniella occidentalis]
MPTPVESKPQPPFRSRPVKSPPEDKMAEPQVAAPAADEEPAERPPHVPLPPLDQDLLAMPPEEYWVSDLRWIVPQQLAVVRAPRNREHLEALVRENIVHLVTLSPDAMPKPEDFPNKIKSTVIPVEEFDMPTDEAVNQFIELCEKAQQKKEAVCVHCRQGRGRAGAFAACWIVRFQGKIPEAAISAVRMLRPGALETLGQERAVKRLHDRLKKNPPAK